MTSDGNYHISERKLQLTSHIRSTTVLFPSFSFSWPSIYINEHHVQGNFFYSCRDHLFSYIWIVPSLSVHVKACHAHVLSHKRESKLKNPASFIGVVRTSNPHSDFVQCVQIGDKWTLHHTSSKNNAMIVVNENLMK